MKEKDEVQKALDDEFEKDFHFHMLNILQHEIYLHFSKFNILTKEQYLVIQKKAIDEMRNSI